MWPGYFSSEYSQIVFDHFEYLFTILSMEKLAEHRIEFGPLAIPPRHVTKGPHINLMRPG